MIPVIGMTMDFSPVTDKRPFGFGDEFFFENAAYLRYVEETQCIPLLLPTLKDLNRIAEMVSAVDGIILTSGDDVLPEYYGEKTMNPNWRIDGHRTYFEAALVAEALGQEKPIYGICRGCQMLNVALGGDMFQDIPTQVIGAIEHSSKNKPKWATHKVTISEDSILYPILNKNSVSVTTSHHQAVRDLAADLQVAATADDGIIEAVEMSNKKIVLGVQWHPEVMDDDPLQLRILEAFIKACGIDH